MHTDSSDFAFGTFPVLQTQRLQLVEITPAHLDDLFQLFGDGKVTAFYNIVTLQKKEEAQRFIDHFRNRYREKAAIRWGIALKGHTNIIGTLGYNNFIPHHRANVGYDLSPEYWNRGYVTEALNAIISFGFNRLHVNRIEAEVMQGNIASERVLQKLGFQKEGVLREWIYWNNRYFDMTMFSLLRRDREMD